MNNKIFTKSLIDIAFCAMVCDSHVDELEMRKLKQIASKDFYFKGIDLDEELNFLTKEFNLKGILTVDHILNDLINFFGPLV